MLLTSSFSLASCSSAKRYVVAEVGLNHGVLGLFGNAGEHPDEIGQPVDVWQQPDAAEVSPIGPARRCGARRGAGQRAPLRARRRPASHRARRIRAASHAFFVPAQRFLDAVEHLLADTRDAILQPVACRRVRRQLRTNHEQFALPTKHRFGQLQEPSRGQLGASHAQSGDRFVDRAVRLGSGVVLGDSAAIKQAGRAVVALCRWRPRSWRWPAGGQYAPTRRGRRRAGPSARPAG